MADDHQQETCWWRSGILFNDVGKTAFFRCADMDLADIVVVGHTRQTLRRDGRQHGARQDIFNITCAGVDFLAACDDIQQYIFIVV